MLNVNPALGSSDVRNIIEMTAAKVGGVVYSTALPNGLWNPLMGYGRIDALAAVLAARPV